MNKEDLIILFSGGADSRLMIEFALKLGYEPYCVMVYYDQLHDQELDSAAIQLKKLGVDYHVVSLLELNIDSGLTGDGIKNDTGDVHEMHVSGRNTMFLSIAYSIAESKGIDTIWIGCDWSDRINLFPDCYGEYIEKANELFKIAGPKPIKVEAPLLGMSKEMIFKLLKYYGIEKDELFSGYGDL